MKVLLVAALVALVHGSYATLLIKGPTEPVMEGERVTLECLFSESEHNISNVHFEISYYNMQRWHQVWERSFCRYPLFVSRTAESVSLHFALSVSFSRTAFRCVSSDGNGTTPHTSQPLSVKVTYMWEPSLSREGFSRYLAVPEELKVLPGEDVVVKCSASSSEEPSYYWNKDGGDWILPSSTLTLRKITAMDAGRYTCMAQHPSVESLTKRHTISITVLSEDAPWYESSYGRLILMTSAAVVVCLLVFILSMSVFLCRRAKQAKTSKGPIDDRSQKKPIYKASVESLPSTCADNQPLV